MDVPSDKDKEGTTKSKDKDISSDSDSGWMFPDDKKAPAPMPNAEKYDDDGWIHAPPKKRPHILKRVVDCLR